MSARSCGRPVRLDAIKWSSDTVGISTPSSSNRVASLTASRYRTDHARVRMSILGESPMMVTNFATILFGRIDQDVDVAGGAGAAPELERAFA